MAGAALQRLQQKKGQSRPGTATLRPAAGGDYRRHAMNDRKKGWGCLIPGGIVMLFAGLASSFDPPALQIWTILFGAAMLVLPAIARVVEVKPQKLRPENLPKGIKSSPSSKRPSLSNQGDSSSPFYSGSARSSAREIPSYDHYDEGHEAGMAAGRQEGWDEGYSLGVLDGSDREINYDDHVPEGAEWRHPDDDPTAR